MVPRVAALVLLVTVCNACSTIRAEVGLGLGIGAMVKVPGIAHTGIAGGAFHHYGHNYSDGWRSGDTGGTGYSLDCDQVLGVFHRSILR
ncbi:MAG: hypothetical protein ACYTDY_13530, partial [Planctomycetota bacterium]